MKKIFIFMLFILTLNLYSEEKNVGLRDIFTNDDLKILDNGNFITRMYVKYNARNENSDTIIDVPKTKYTPEDYSVYEILTDEKVFIPYILTEKSKLDFYNTLTAFSKLQGMTYYSRSASKIEKLIVKCYRVESLSGNKHDDKIYTKIQPKTSNMFLQKDNKLGTLIFRSDLYNEGNNFIMINTCLQPISSAFITINNKEDYKIVTFFIYDENKKGYYLYSVQSMRVRMDGILKNKAIIKPTTFSNRLRASTVHLAKLLGIDWQDRLNPWPGKYDSYK